MLFPRLITPRGTTAHMECSGIRERWSREVLHLRIDDKISTCAICGVTTGPNEPWMDSKERHERHNDRCLPHVA